MHLCALIRLPCTSTIISVAISWRNILSKSSPKRLGCRQDKDDSSMPERLILEAKLESALRSVCRYSMLSSAISLAESPPELLRFLDDSPSSELQLELDFGRISSFGVSISSFADFTLHRAKDLWNVSNCLVGVGCILLTRLDESFNFNGGNKPSNCLLSLFGTKAVVVLFAVEEEQASPLQLFKILSGSLELSLLLTGENVSRSSSPKFTSHVLVDDPLPLRLNKSKPCNGRRISSLYWGADDVVDDELLVVQGNSRKKHLRHVMLHCFKKASSTGEICIGCGNGTTTIRTNFSLLHMY
uniref:Uncharacterized protein n=1 Tax=Glossina austeni TaxID=7395 RepID=A0A1A9VYQ4_GLOAU